MLIDSHAHLQAAEFERDRAQVVGRAAAAGVGVIVCPATDASSCQAALALARGGLPVAPAAGIHPGSVDRVAPDEWERVRALAREPEIVAIGETGLDYYRDRASAVEQRASFLRHLALAGELGLPVVVHNREADDDVLRAVADWRAGAPERVAILHCFVGDADLAARALELGCYLGFGGPITFKSADALRAVARELPLDRVLVETDAPYLAPAPHRGSRNEPARVRLVAQMLADLRGLSLAEIADATSANARRVFGDRLARLGSSGRHAAPAGERS